MSLLGSGITRTTSPTPLWSTISMPRPSSVKQPLAVRVRSAHQKAKTTAFLRVRKAAPKISPTGNEVQHIAAWARGGQTSSRTGCAMQANTAVRNNGDAPNTVRLDFCYGWDAGARTVALHPQPALPSCSCTCGLHPHPATTSVRRARVWWVARIEPNSIVSGAVLIPKNFGDKNE